MPVELRNVPGAPEPQGFSHCSIATGQRIVHCAGQVGTDDEGQVPEGGLAAQTEQAMLNLGRVLDTAGVTEQDLVKLTVYVVGWDPSMFEAFGQGMLAARVQRPAPDVPVTLIGVASLFMPDHLVEIEAVAIA